MARRKSSGKNHHSQKTGGSGKCKNRTDWDDENFTSFKDQLARLGLTLREIQGDGNCLFRALNDQMEGNTRNHIKYRLDTVEYMKKHREDFEPFVEDDVPFDDHLSNLAQPGTYAGNDAIVAFARLHETVIVIHQLNSPLWQVKGTDKASATELHLSYHNGDHYNSVRKIGDNSQGPANIRLSIVDSTDKPLVEKKPTGSIVYLSEEDKQALIARIAEKTKCEDKLIIQEALTNFDLDEQKATDHVLSIMMTCDSEDMILEEKETNTLWTKEGTGTRIFGEAAAVMATGKVSSENEPGSPAKQNKTNSAKKRMSAREKKDLKKQERKLRSLDRKRESMGLTENKSEPPRDSNSVLVVKNLSCLSI